MFEFNLIINIIIIIIVLLFCCIYEFCLSLELHM
jgi:hypothetical protein